jgi:predicted transposase YdaD
VRLVNADVSTLTLGSDKVFEVSGPKPWLLHLEAQSDHEITLDERVHLYNTVLGYRHQKPVRSLVILLRRAADSPRLTGLLEHQEPDGDWYRRYRYRVVRLWELPVEVFLEGGLGVLPLAPVSDVAPEALPDVIRRMKKRLQPQPLEERGYLWTATYILMGLSYTDELTNTLLEGVLEMEQSVTYQAIVKKGEAREKRKMLLLLGSQRFGAPDAHTAAAIEAITDLDRLEQLALQLNQASSWEELLATSHSRRRDRRRSRGQ